MRRTFLISVGFDSDVSVCATLLSNREKEEGNLNPLTLAPLLLLDGTNICLETEMRALTVQQQSIVEKESRIADIRGVALRW